MHFTPTALLTLLPLTLASPLGLQSRDDTTCNQNQSVACCDVVDNLGLGTGCVFGCEYFARIRGLQRINTRARVFLRLQEER